MTHNFFALINRMKYINRWGLMRNSREENLSEHSLDTAVIAHALAVINNVRFNGNLNPERIAVLAMYHDASEIITGDLPTPVKYANDDIKQAYKDVEKHAIKNLCDKLPLDLREAYADILNFNGENDKLYKSYIKAADKISALIKCLEEKQSGNTEFKKAELSTLSAINSIDLPEVKVFLEEFLPSYDLTLDELSNNIPK